MRQVYLDYSATTPVKENIANYIYRLMIDNYGNPSSLHKMGVSAQNILETARGQISNTLRCEKDNIYFTSGGTEANNLAIIGGVLAKRRRGNKIIITAFEHSSVLDAAKWLETQGFEVIYCEPDTSGCIDADTISDMVDDNTILVSCMMVNNEIGTILPIEEIVGKVRHKKKDVLIHTDAVAGFGKIPVHSKRLDVDLITITGHKIYAPKGIGALYIKKGVRILPILYGGEQQKRIRPGTENTAFAGGLGLASEIASKSINNTYIFKLREHLLSGLKIFSDVCNNSPENSTPYIVNCSIMGIRSEIMLHFLENEGIYLSSGSACSKGAKSHVLSAMRLPRDVIDSAIRISLSEDTGIEDIDYLLEKIELARNKLRR